MASVTIGGNDYDSFADLAFANIYNAADPLNSAAWSELDDDGKGQNLVASTRILKRLSWANGVPAFDQTPTLVQEATAEFAAAIAGGYDLGADPASSLQIRSQKAGSVSVEYFRNLDAPSYVPPPLPKTVWDMLQPMLSTTGLGIIPGSLSWGTRDCFEGFETPRYIGSGVTGDRNYN